MTRPCGNVPNQDNQLRTNSPYLSSAWRWGWEDAIFLWGFAVSCEVVQTYQHQLAEPSSLICSSEMEQVMRFMFVCAWASTCFVTRPSLGKDIIRDWHIHTSVLRTAHQPKWPSFCFPAALFDVNVPVNYLSVCSLCLLLLLSKGINQKSGTHAEQTGGFIMGSIVYHADLRALLYAHICALQSNNCLCSRGPTSPSTYCCTAYSFYSFTPKTPVNNASIA